MDLVRDLVREVEKQGRHADNWQRLQREASARPESTLVETPAGGIWMSPIESKLYEAMRAEGLVPTPQYCIEGYFVDFAFPDIRLAVEADGAEFHSGAGRQRDRKRDWILSNAGWQVKRFHGSTIHNKAGNCAFVIKRDVEGARAAEAQRVKELYLRRQQRSEAILAPFRKLMALFRRKPAAPPPRQGPPPAR